MDPLTILAGVLTGLNELKRTGTFDALKDHIEDFTEAARSALPAKADGTDWTDADIEELATGARHKLASIDARHGG